MERSKREVFSERVSLMASGCSWGCPGLLPRGRRSGGHQIGPTWTDLVAITSKLKAKGVELQILTMNLDTSTRPARHRSEIPTAPSYV
jgi:hypothetical protein